MDCAQLAADTFNISIALYLSEHLNGCLHLPFTQEPGVRVTPIVMYLKGSHFYRVLVEDPEDIVWPATSLLYPNEDDRALYGLKYFSCFASWKKQF